jgi:hypothetical protein
MKRRSIVILAVSFSVVLAAGVALAQVGAFAPTFGELQTEVTAGDFGLGALDPEAPAASTLPQEEATQDTEEPPAEEVETPDASTDEPKDEPVDKPATEPAEEPKEEPVDTTPPKLTITAPDDGAHFGEKTLKYRGMTEPGARVFAGEWEADVFENGEWHIVLILSPGKNLTTFKAIDAAGNVATATVAAYLDVTDTKFTAYQKYGTNSSPWEKFHGTAAPGTVIELMSKYGNARMVTEGHEWYLKLHFEGLTEATTFPIVLESSTGQRMEFSFTFEPKVVDFSASQKYGTNSYPWEKFHGTAMPGTVIELSSDFGNARIVAEGYEWYLKLHFEGLTEATTFPIVLHASTGHVMEFSFTYQPKPIEFTAYQKYGSCSEPEPYDKYFGTATPGTTVTVSSDYGSGSTVAAANGEWLVRVYFTGAPTGVPFTVTVSDSEGHSKMFEFVSYADK